MPTSSLLLKVVARAALTAVLMAVVIVLGQIPWGKPGEEAALRIALRTVQGKAEICRDLTEAEKRNLPVHMQGVKNCDFTPVPYRLLVSVDGRTMIDETVEAGGLRRDRPHNVDQEFSLPPGTEEVVVLFEPQFPADASPEDVLSFADVPSFELRQSLELRADRVTLIYLDDQTGKLEVLGG